MVTITDKECNAVVVITVYKRSRYSQWLAKFLFANCTQNNKCNISLVMLPESPIIERLCPER